MEFSKIAVASGNDGKIAEIKSIFTGVEIISMHELGFTDEIEETGKRSKKTQKSRRKRLRKSTISPPFRTTPDFA